MSHDYEVIVIGGGEMCPPALTSRDEQIRAADGCTGCRLAGGTRR
jgi:hypothetical protein